MKNQQDLYQWCRITITRKTTGLWLLIRSFKHRLFQHPFLRQIQVSHTYLKLISLNCVLCAWILINLQHIHQMIRKKSVQKMVTPERNPNSVSGFENLFSQEKRTRRHPIKIYQKIVELWQRRKRMKRLIHQRPNGDSVG